MRTAINSYHQEFLTELSSPGLSSYPSFVCNNDGRDYKGYMKKWCENIFYADDLTEDSWEEIKIRYAQWKKINDKKGGKVNVKIQTLLHWQKNFSNKRKQLAY